MSVEHQTIVCGAITRRGLPCKAYPMPGTNPPRCYAHRRERALPGGRTRCHARTVRGRACRLWAQRGEKHCHLHRRRGRQARRCSAVTARGKQCRSRAVKGSRPARCVVHGPRGRRAQRCQGRNKDGRRCRALATRESVVRGRPRCFSHAASFLGPGRKAKRPGHHRCEARTKAGERCRAVAQRQSKARDGRWLCIYHAEDGQAVNPGPRSRVRKGRRCTARTPSGERCRRWALSSHPWPGDEPLCVHHSGYPFKRRVLHGYYSERPRFTPEERAAILRAVKSGEPLAAELLIVRFNLQRLLHYLKRKDLSPWRRDAATRSALEAVNAVRRLMQARHNLARTRWTPSSGGNAGKQLEALLGEEEE